jgi:enamine deaminase RidA (YjgF/YER057c/UK114 family)
MAEYFSEPYPARAAVEISALPKQAQIEIDAIVVLN